MSTRAQQHKATERLKDLRAYRQTLIHRISEEETKLKATEDQIRRFQEASHE